MFPTPRRPLHLLTGSAIVVALAQDLVVVNITREQIALRQAQTSLLHWTSTGPKEQGGPKLDLKTRGTTHSLS